MEGEGQSDNSKEDRQTNGGGISGGPFFWRINGKDSSTKRSGPLSRSKYPEKSPKKEKATGQLKFTRRMVRSRYNTLCLPRGVVKLQAGKRTSRKISRGMSTHRPAHRNSNIELTGYITGSPRVQIPDGDHTYTQKVAHHKMETVIGGKTLGAPKDEGKKSEGKTADLGHITVIEKAFTSETPRTRGEVEELI